MAALLKGRDLHRSFGRVQALRGACLELAAGEIVAVIGPSGSGKSTLLHCLAGILAPDLGEVWFDGRRLDELPDRERAVLRRSEFGFVFQFGQLIPELPAIENIALPLLLAGRRRRDALAEAGTWLTRLGLDGLDTRMPGELAGGEGQRVALARALITGPRIVFADEPTGALDSIAADQVMELLVDTARELGAGVLLVTHEPRVAAYADRTVLVRDGLDVLARAGAS
ncbi:ABC transporter ATP-binding protein [Actinoplanes sp. NPDC051861]|uniref:ABC transporter ATP-binding protein n=1 Tax=Actinoplanes sp. NPDC051861 TaxID=3155170 RepID=UPI00343A88DA